MVVNSRFACWRLLDSGQRVSNQRLHFIDRQSWLVYCCNSLAKMVVTYGSIRDCCIVSLRSIDGCMINMLLLHYRWRTLWQQNVD